MVTSLEYGLTIVEVAGFIGGGLTLGRSVDTCTMTISAKRDHQLNCLYLYPLPLPQYRRFKDASSKLRHELLQVQPFNHRFGQLYFEETRLLLAMLAGGCSWSRISIL